MFGKKLQVTIKIQGNQKYKTKMHKTSKLSGDKEAKIVAFLNTLAKISLCSFFFVFFFTKVVYYPVSHIKKMSNQLNR